MIAPALERKPVTAQHSLPDTSTSVVFNNVSKFYGEVLGVNRVSLTIPPGITSLVGPNGAGKTTLMNLMAGLIRPSCGEITVLGLTPADPERFYRALGYCTQFDSFQRGVTGREFVEYALRLHGCAQSEAVHLAQDAIGRVGMLEAADRKVAGYSKGMRQRIRLAQAISHRPPVLILDEPLNGLDPMARAETLSLFQELGREGLHVIISSHILHEVDQISDQVILLSYGYVVAEGRIRGVREEVKEHPMRILVRCDKPSLLASRMFLLDSVVEARLVQADTDNSVSGVLVSTRDATEFYAVLNALVVAGELDLESVAPADDDVLSVYQYLIGNEGASE